MFRAGGRYKNLRGPVLYNLDRLENFLKAPLYQIWEILGGAGPARILYTAEVNSAKEICANSHSVHTNLF